MPNYGVGRIQYGVDQYGRFQKKKGGGWELRPVRIRIGGANAPWIYAHPPVKVPQQQTSFRVKTKDSEWYYGMNAIVYGKPTAVRVRTPDGEWVQSAEIGGVT